MHHVWKVINHPKVFFCSFLYSTWKSAKTFRPKFDNHPETFKMIEKGDKKFSFNLILCCCRCLQVSKEGKKFPTIWGTCILKWCPILGDAGSKMGSFVKSHVYLLSMYLKSMSQKSMCPNGNVTKVNMSKRQWC